MTWSKFLPVALAALIAPPAVADSWLDDVVRVEVLDGGSAPNGTHRAAIRFTLAEGWKTYWRAPGDAGIPPEFSWRGSRNVGATRIMWPTPKVFDQNGMRSVATAEEIEEMFELLRDQEIPNDRQTWNRRYRGFMEKIRTGSLFEVAEVFHLLQQTGHLSFCFSEC